MSSPETDWTNAYNYTIADEAEALKAHLLKSLDKIKDLEWKLKLKTLKAKSHRQVLELWRTYSMSGELDTNRLCRQLMESITEIALIEEKE